MKLRIDDLFGPPLRRLLNGIHSAPPSSGSKRIHKGKYKDSEATTALAIEI